MKITDLCDKFVITKKNPILRDIRELDFSKQQSNFCSLRVNSVFGCNGLLQPLKELVKVCLFKFCLTPSKN